jgi:hypothetical protein
MNSILKYRFVAFALVVVFGVFNIGIPIIIASCPMAAMMQASTCGMCNDQGSPSTSRISTEKDFSCCATKIVAERNTNEFVQAKRVADNAINQCAIALPLSELVPVVHCSLFIARYSPPISTVDIPILTSSLLI